MENKKEILFKRKGTYLGAFFVFAGALFFSAKAVLVKMIYLESKSVDHVVLLTLRMGFSLPFFLAIAFYHQRKTHELNNKLLPNDWLMILGLGFGGYYLSSVFDFWGLEYVTASLERLILFIYPTIVVLLSLIVFRRRLNKTLVFSLMLAYLGIAIVLFGEQLNENVDVIKGVILIFLAAFTYACYLVGSEKMIFRLGNAQYTSVVMSIACACVLIHFFVLNDLDTLNLSPSILYKALFMAIFCTVIPSFLISEGIKRIGASNASVIASIGPVSTIFLARYFLEEKIEPIQILGTFFVIAGVLVTSLYGKVE